MNIPENLKATFNGMKEGINIIDKEGRFIFLNKAYMDFLNEEEGRDMGDLTGTKLIDLRPGAKLPEVVETGIPIHNALRQESHVPYIVSLYPIKFGGEIIGGFAIIIFMDALQDMKKTMEDLEERSHKVLHRINKANGARYSFNDFVAVSEAAVRAKSIAMRIAKNDAHVLINGESGTGKELFAHAIHSASPRSDKVFVAINCSNFNGQLLDSELFGYVDGAFTGARKGGKIGLFEATDGGTLFLDEISEMDIGLQAKLLRVLQEGMIRPVGGVKEIPVNVRVIAACNVNLKEYAEEGKFRKDLYYRLSTFPIHIPSLRERVDDIPILAEDFLDQLSKKQRKNYKITEDALGLLKAYDWPGNVRELRNVLEFAAIISETGVVKPEDLPDQIKFITTDEVHIPLAERVKAFEKREIKRMLEVNGNTVEGKKKTAQQLGISLASLYNKLS